MTSVSAGHMISWC